MLKEEKYATFAYDGTYLNYRDGIIELAAAIVRESLIQNPNRLDRVISVAAVESKEIIPPSKDISFEHTEVTVTVTFDSNLKHLHKDRTICAGFNSIRGAGVPIELNRELPFMCEGTMIALFKNQGFNLLQSIFKFSGDYRDAEHKTANCKMILFKTTK